MKNFIFYFLFGITGFSQLNPHFTIGRIKYDGGGDWYNDPSAEVNLLTFVENELGIKTNKVYSSVDLTDPKIFNYPLLFLTGHGNVVFAPSGITNLRKYLENGGFLYVDDDYGLEKSIKRELKKVFPDEELIELPFSHPIYNNKFKFLNGPPKIHEHDKKPARGYGIFIGERMVVYLTIESNPGDGWADKEVHKDSETTRRRALEFGANIIKYVLTN